MTCLLLKRIPQLHDGTRIRQPPGHARLALAGVRLLLDRTDTHLAHRLAAAGAPAFALAEVAVLVVAVVVGLRDADVLVVVTLVAAQGW